MKMQFGGDPKRDGIERRAQIICMICFGVIFIFDLFGIFNGTKIWSEAIKSDWPIALLLIGVLPGRISLYAPLALLPIVAWFQLGAGPLNLEMLRHALWQVWWPVALWVSYVLLLFSLLCTGRLFMKNGKAAT
jgi:hypothetical protein